MRRILLSCGGTGGHISPGIALIEEIYLKKEDLKVTYLAIHAPKRNKDNPDLQDLPIPIHWHTFPQWKKSKILVYPFLFFYTIIQTFFLIRKHKINCVIGMGGYSTIPALTIAKLLGLDIYLCEQNCIPGAVTRWFSKYCKKLALSFPLSEELKNHCNYKILGNPLRRSVLPKNPGLKWKSISKKNPANVLVLGGSQGARQINNMVLDIINNTNLGEFFRFRILTGTNLYDEVKDKSSKLEAISYSKDMRTHYEWADLVICRAGAGVLAECSAYGLPMVLIPYPYAKDNHQKANALYYLKNNACILLDTKSEDSKDLKEILEDLIQNPDKIRELSKGSLSLSAINAAKDTIYFFFYENK